MTEYKYDIAFSFLAEDESLATQLTDLLQDRYKVFLYSSRQEDLAGGDGEKLFNAVFGEESRLVIVLYRNEWGQTSWTRIEETVIRNRAHDHGFDFVIFMPLDELSSVPKWVPKNQLWVNLKRFGIERTVGVIEANIQKLWGEVREESLEDRSKRLLRAITLKLKRDNLFLSRDGVAASKTEFQELKKEFFDQWKSSVLPSVVSEIYDNENDRNSFQIISSYLSLGVTWAIKYGNTLEKSKLKIEFWKGGVRRHSYDDPVVEKSFKFDFFLSDSEQYVWQSEAKDKREFTSQYLAKFILKKYLDEIQETLHPSKPIKRSIYY